MEALLRSQGAMDDEFVTSVAADADRLAAEVRSACLTAVSRTPLGVMDHVYEEPHSGLDEERENFRAYLEGFGDAAADAEGAGR